MKRALIPLFSLCLFVSAKAESLENPLLKKLVEKGVLTEEEAVKIEKSSSEKLKKHATVINQSSPDFPLGKETHPNIKIRAFDKTDMYVKLGIRLQSTFENYKVDYNDPTRDDVNLWDAYLRRMRLEVGVGFSKNVSFTMDIRNDKSNYQDKGEGDFNVGDAYLKIKKPFKSLGYLVNFKFYRGKIDVSRTETVKSAWVVHYDRPHVADEAAQFISHNRRATNAQIYGNWKHIIHYQLAFGDAVYSGKFKDATEYKDLKSKGGEIKEQDYFYGGKIFISPPGWEEKKRTETYFGKGKHFEVGVGYWVVPKIKYKDPSNNTHEIDRTLINYELSGHYKGLFIQAEYFDFDGVVKDWITNEIGKSKGWYITGEYVVPELYYIAPFIRYEKWDRWDGEGDYTLKSTVAGINWYLRGNTTKVGVAYQIDDYGADIGDKKIKRLKFLSQWFF